AVGAERGGPGHERRAAARGHRLGGRAASAARGHRLAPAERPGRTLTMRPRRLLLLLVAIGLPAAALHAAAPQFWRLEGARAFLEGDLEGVTVDSEGRLRLGPTPRARFDPEAPDAWAVGRDAKG